MAEFNLLQLGSNLQEARKKYILLSPFECNSIQIFCGEGGIRTPGAVARTTVFETATIDRSATSPERLPRMRSAGEQK